MLEIMSDFPTQKNQTKNGKRKKDKQINDKEFIINNNKILINSAEAKKDKSNNYDLDIKNIFVKKYQLEICKLNKYEKIYNNKSIISFESIFLSYFFILNILFISINTQKINYRKLQSTNDILIKISGPGLQKVLTSYSSFSSAYYPSHIIVDNIIINFTSNYEINVLENETKYVILQWESESEPAKLDYIFRDLTNLIEVDFSNFTFSQSSMNWAFDNCKNLEKIIFNNEVTTDKMSFYSTFSDCSSLKSIDLTCFSESKITNTGYMFKGCYSITSINISKLDTSQNFRTDYMFYNCSSLTSIDLSSFNTATVTVMGNMFENCKNCTKLKSLNISNFDLSSVKSMSTMFKACTSLTSLLLPNFDATLLTNMRSMFTDCSSLISLDLSGLGTYNAQNMGYMFSGCSSLISLNLSNFDTGSVTAMDSMFYNCKSLISLNLSKFDTTKTNNINSMFKGCSNLKYVDISNFNLSVITSMTEVFSGCTDLAYINFDNFAIKEGFSIGDIFQNVPGNVIYCISNNEYIGIIENLLNSKICTINDCSNDWIKIKKIILKKKMYVWIVVRKMKHIKFGIIINAFQFVQLIIMKL